MSGLSHGVAFNQLDAAFFNSSATAPKMVRAFFSFNLSSMAIARRSGAQVGTDFFWRNLAHHDALLYAALREG